MCSTSILQLPTRHTLPTLSTVAVLPARPAWCWIPMDPTKPPHPAHGTSLDVDTRSCHALTHTISPSCVVVLLMVHPLHWQWEQQ